MTYTLALDLKHYIPLIAEEIDFSLHHLPLRWTMFHKNVWRLVQFEALADLVNPKLQAKVETTE